MKYKPQFSVFSLVLVATLCATALAIAGNKAVGESQFILSWAYSVAAVLLMVELLVFGTRRAESVRSRAAAQGKQRESLPVPRTCSKCSAEAEPGFEACWACGTWFDSATGSTSVAGTIPADGVVESPCERDNAAAESGNIRG